MQDIMPDFDGLIYLLKSRAEINRLSSGDTLCLTVRDADVYGALVRIIGNDAQCRMDVSKIPAGHRLTVTKI